MATKNKDLPSLTMKDVDKFLQTLNSKQRVYFLSSCLCACLCKSIDISAMIKKWMDELDYDEAKALLEKELQRY